MPVASAADAHRIVTKGAQNRHVAATAMNRESSRSHSVFTLAIEGKVRPLRWLRRLRQWQLLLR